MIRLSVSDPVRFNKLVFQQIWLFEWDLDHREDGYFYYHFLN